MMEKAKLLAENSVGNIQRCPGGCVHINIPGVSLHLNEFQFVSLSRMMQEASSKLMDHTLRMLCDDTNKDEEAS